MTRDELYALVWETPSVHVASRLGMSNAALRKLCETYNVPLPPAGYWTKVAYGKQTVRTPLPKEAPTLLKKIGGALRRIGQASLDMTDAQIADYTLDIPAPPAAAREHAARIRTIGHLEKTLAAAPRDEAGFVTVSLANVIECRVGATSQARAVALADALIETALTFDCVLSENDGLSFNGESIALRIYETRATPQMAPSGRMCLELFDPRPFQWTRRNLIGHWHDRNGRPVEQTVRHAIAAAINIAPLVKRVRAAADIDTRRRAAEATETTDTHARQARTEREQQFLRDKARALAELTELNALAAELGRDKVFAQHGRGRILLGALAATIVSLEGKLGPAGLVAELDALDLFGDRAD